LPFIHPTLFFREERRGILGVLKPETREGTQGLLKKSDPCKGSGGG
jgi:hypothetical protein